MSTKLRVAMAKYGLLRRCIVTILLDHANHFVLIEYLK